MKKGNGNQEKIEDSEEYIEIINSKGQKQIRILKGVHDLIESHIKNKIVNVGEYASEKLLKCVMKDIKKEKESKD